MSRKVIKFDSLANAVATTEQARDNAISATGEAETATNNANTATSQAVEAATQALGTAGVDPDFISYEVGVLPDSTGAVVGTIGAYYTDAGTLQRLEWSGTEWLDKGEAVLTRNFAEIGFRPIRDEKFRATNDHTIIASRLDDGLLYSRKAGETFLYSSDNGGQTWTQLSQLVGTVVLLVKAGDGEVLAACASAGVFRSSGWASNPATATWSVVLESSGSDFLSWGLDTNGDVAIATHYSASNYLNSQFVWLSQDNGQNWTVIRDLGTDLTHLHFAAIDEYANNRFWISWHRQTSDGIEKAIEYSDNLGEDWTVLSNQWQPTTAVATRWGMVMGTDDGPGGILHVRRTADPSDMIIELVARFPVESTPFAHVFAVYSQYDIKTDTAYVTFINQVDGAPAGIFASDGRVASEIYRTARQFSVSGQRPGFREFGFQDGKIFIRTTIYNPDTVAIDSFIFESPLVIRGDSNPNFFDKGRIFGGRLTGSNPFRSLASGVFAEAGPSTDATAVGFNARAGNANTGSPGATAVGESASAPNAGSTAIGSKASAPSGSTCVGESATAATVDVAVGRTATAGGNAVAIGNSAVARTGSVGIGRNAGPQTPNVSSDYTAIGRDAKAESRGVAIGRDAKALNIDSVALGNGTETNETNQVAIGDKGLTMGNRSAMANPAGKASIWFQVIDGVQTLRVRFANGVTKTILTDEA